MSNFSYLQQVPELAQLHKFCLRAEQYQKMDPDASANNSRKALEWMVGAIYRLKNKAEEFKDASLRQLLEGYPFQDFIGKDPRIMKECIYIKNIGNVGSHPNGEVGVKQAFFSVLDLYNVIGGILQKLGIVANLAPFSEDLLKAAQGMTVSLSVDNGTSQPTQTEAAALSSTVDQSAVNNTDPVVEPKTTAVSEAETRAAYIDMMLREANWDILETKGAIMPGKACIEVKVEGMPTTSGIGYADYVLFGMNGKPLAVIEAKKTSVDLSKGKQQAMLYAERLEAQYGVRPVVYCSNGFNTEIIDDGMGYPPRPLMGFHTLNDLAVMYQHRSRGKITDMKVRTDIAGREYQQQGIHSVCEWMNSMHRRALLVMATGTGKTRTSIALTELLMRNGWVKNMLFLADRTALVDQAYKNFVKLLPDYPACALSETSKSTEKTELEGARIVFSTYQTMIKRIEGKDKTFSVGYFDLIIIDEAHRSVFGKFGSIFDYFDSLLVGLTATPRDEVDKSTYDLLGLDGEPNFSYELKQAVQDEYLVNYHAIQKGTLMLSNGIKYDSLSKEDKDQLEVVWEYEASLLDAPSGSKIDPHDIEANKIFSYIFNKQTVDIVLRDLMEHGLRVNSGETIGKSIIFAYNHKHAELIVERFHELFPEYGSQFCVLIDNQVNYALDLIHKFEVRGKLPQIAVSVDMLDTGIDVPDILNLVFFKPVRSKIKFWQMIGRGTRLSEDIFGEGQNKKFFMIYDWCHNFDFFSQNPDGVEATQTLTLSQRLFIIKSEVAQALQLDVYQEDEFASGLHDRLKDELCSMVQQLDPHNISVRKYWSLVEKYSVRNNWLSLSVLDLQDLRDFISPLIKPQEGEESAKKLDLILFQVELGKVNPMFVATKSVSLVYKIAENLKKQASIPQIKAKLPVLKEICTPGYVEEASLQVLEKVREELRELVKFLDGKKTRTFTLNLEDIAQEGEEVENDLPNMTYKQRVFEYLMENKELPVLQKIYNLEPLTPADIVELNRIFLQELGTEDEFKRDTMSMGDITIAIFIRSIIGIDRKKALLKFRDLIQNKEMNSAQEDYISSIIGYVCQNGDITPQDIIKSGTPFPNLIKTFGPLAVNVADYIKQIHSSIEPVRKDA